MPNPRRAQMFSCLSFYYDGMIVDNPIGNDREESRQKEGKEVQRCSNAKSSPGADVLMFVFLL